MRPKLLEIEGLQSFTEAQTIDFDTLGESGLFGIFGPTGSGKSTILDAITFALYGRVKRAEGGTQGIINSKCSKVRVAFTFELSRNGTRTCYRVERTYQRKKGSANACEPKVVRLIELTEDGDVPLCDKATEVSSKIRELLGLNSEDFTRAVVIPQNSFQEFLMLSNSDRRGMLERIFYLEEYGRQLTDKISKRIGGLKSRMDVLTGELAGYADASPEALEEAKRALEAAVQARDAAMKELEGMEAAFCQAKEVWGLVCDICDIDGKLDEHRTKEQEISVKRQRLERAVKADGLAAVISQTRALGTKLDDTNARLKDVLAELPGVSRDLTDAKNGYERVRREAAAEKPRLVEQRTRLNDALGIKNEISSLSARMEALKLSASEIAVAADKKSKEIKGAVGDHDLLKKRLDELSLKAESLRTKPEYRREIQEGVTLENEIAALDKNRKLLQEKKDAVTKTIGMLEKKLAAVRDEIAEIRKAQEELAAGLQDHAGKKPGDRTSVLKMIDRVRMAQNVYQMMLNKRNEIEQCRSKYDGHRTALKETEARCRELEEAKKAAEDVCEKRRFELEQCIRELDRHSAYTLSKKLRDGEPCPVCGSVTHPAPAAFDSTEGTEDLEKTADDARSRLADAESGFREAEKAALIAEENLKTRREQLDLAAREMEQKESEYEAERQKLPEKLKELGAEQLRQEIEKADTMVNEKLQAVEVWEREENELKEQKERQNNAAASLRISENGINSELKVNYDNGALLDKELEDLGKKLADLSRRHSELLTKYSVTSAGAELARLSENDRILSLTEAELEKTRKLVDEMRLGIDRSNEELAKLNQEHIKLETDIRSIASQIGEKEARLAELTGGTDIDEGIRSIDERLSRMDSEEKEYAQRLERLEKLNYELSTKKSMLSNQLNIFTEDLQRESAKLADSLAEKGFSGPEEAEASILGAEAKKELKDAIDQFDQVLFNLTAQRQMLERKLGTRTITQEEWERTERSYTELSERAKNCVSACEVARSRYSSIEEKHQRWVGIKKEYDEVSHKYGLFDQIQRLLSAKRGKENSFIDYIAEERLRYVAANASTTLDEITGHKYAIELDAESGFIIRDNANGGIHRMVASLSGGETFLTSLSLALALSEQIQLKGQSPLEFFFLDEGFGTLDHELLDTVLDSLERLSSKQRVIGVISHVPELRARIGRRLIVTPPNFAGDGSRVTIEKA
jgi:exonuclease SbcC